MEALKYPPDPFSKVPDYLKELPRWVLWKKEKRGKEFTKVPYQPDGKRKASPTDPQTWSTYSAVLDALKSSTDFAGIGFVLNGDGVTCIDIDHCVDESSGVISPEALEALEDLDSYTEYSPSGSGFHIWLVGSLPLGSGNRRKPFEVYDTARYITITGDHWGQSPQSLKDRQEELELFCQKWIKNTSPSTKQVLISKSDLLHSVSEDRLRELQQRLEGVPGFVTLFRDGDISRFQGDDSRAVHGLLHLFAEATRHPAEIKALFELSALHKGHWVVKWARRAKDEIEKVLQAEPEFGVTNSKRLKATFEDEKRLIRDTFPDKLPKTDLFTGRLHVWHKGRWLKAAASGPVEILESKMRHSGGYFAPAGLHAAISRYAEELEPELLVEIPEWDGRDRVAELADACNVVNISKEHFAQFVKAWGAKMFLRAYDNRKHQNTCLIFKGGQGIGKDYWINTLVGGLDWYAADYSPQKDEVRKAQILSSLLVVKIPEFERTNKIDADALKFDITSNGEQAIAKYGRESQRFEYRCSWIGSANTFDFFRDHTGNRRFWVFVLDGKPHEAIRRGYPDSDQDKLQILAQFKQLAADGYEVSKEALKEMDKWVARMTPEDPIDQLVQDFDDLVMEHMRREGLGRFKEDVFKRQKAWRVTNSDLNSWQVFERLAKLHGMKAKNIRTSLKGRDRSWETTYSRGYLAIDTFVTGVTDEMGNLSPEVSYINI